MNTRKNILWILLAGVTGVILFFGFIFFSFLNSIPPCGFNDGPFFGRTIELDIDTLNFDTSVSTELGKYGIVNRTDKQAPILVKSTNHQLDWALELDVSLEPKFSNTFFWSAERLSYDSVNNKLIFLAHWSFGGEQGTIYLTDTGELEQMCLSW